MFHLGPPQLPSQAAPGPPVPSVCLLLWKGSFLECSYFHPEKALCFYVHRTGYAAVNKYAVAEECFVECYYIYTYVIFSSLVSDPGMAWRQRWCV